MKVVYEASLGEGAGYIVYEEHQKLYLYSISQYGVMERFECIVSDVQEAVDITRKWT